MKVSIITICRNAELSIEKTIQSVISQTYADVEYIIVDGKSSDKTLEIVKKYKKNISRIVSEPDKGLYDAMNKGVLLATGDIIYFLNSGDRLHGPDVIKKIVPLFKNEDYDLVYGDVFLFEENKISPKYLKRQDNVDRLFLVNDNVCHQSIFAKKSLFIKYGLFELDFPICADFAWFLKLFLEKEVNKKHVNLVVADYLLGGISSNRKKFDLEHYQVLLRYFTKWQILFYKLLSKTRPMRRFYAEVVQEGNKKKILLISPSSGVGGAESVLIDLINGLKDNYELFLITHRGSNKLLLKNEYVRRIFVTQYFNGALETSLNLLNILILPIGVIKNFFLTVSIIKRNNIDIVISNSGTIFYPALASKFCGINIFTILHEKIENNFWRKLFFKINEKYSKNIIFVSSFLENQFPETKKSIVINPGLPEQIQKELSQVRHEEHQKLIIGHVGTIYPTKGTDIFVKSAIETCLKSKDLKFHVYGKILDKKYFNSIQNEVKACNLNNRINFFHDKQTVEIFSGIDLLVVSSRFETYGLVILEALASGVPVISFDVGIANEIIKNGENGFLIESKDPEAISLKLLALETDRNKLKIMSASAHRQSLSNSTASFSEQLSHIINS